MRTALTRQRHLARQRHVSLWRGGSPPPPRPSRDRLPAVALAKAGEVAGTLATRRNRPGAVGREAHRAAWARHGVVLLALALGCAVTGGCGLLFLPEVTERPAAALRTVEVVDAVTGEAVPAAEIRLARIPWSNDMRPRPWVRWGVAQSAEGAVRRLAPKTDPADVPQTQPARHLGEGRFAIAPHPQWLWHQVLFPFGSPPDYGPYYTQQAHLVVSAPGYRAVWVSDPWLEPSEEGPPPVRYEFGPAEPAQPGPRVRLTEAGLRIALPPRSLPTRSPAWRRTQDRRGEQP